MIRILKNWFVCVNGNIAIQWTGKNFNKFKASLPFEVIEPQETQGKLHIVLKNKLIVLNRSDVLVQTTDYKFHSEREQDFFTKLAFQDLKNLAPRTTLDEIIKKLVV